MSCYQSSTCGVAGSANSFSHFHSSTVSFQQPSAYAAAKMMYTTQRIATYVNDPADSQILYRYSSVDASVQAHKKSIKTYLDTFNAAYDG